MYISYRTSEVAKIIGIHPNTVRLYEEMGLISKPERMKNGYRVFNDCHIEQFRLARIALQVEVLQNGLRKMAIDIIKTSANGNLEKAENIAEQYLNQIKSEQSNAEEAIEIVKQLLSGEKHETEDLCLTRKQTADYLNLTMDMLRNWEMNGLLNIKRQQNGYRVYTNEDIRQLKIIRSLRCANYSLASILRLLNELSCDPQANIKEVIDTPNETDDVISVCDKLLTSLCSAETNAVHILSQLAKMKKL
jgi:DNA-binding transcriptional MerR regulator